MSITPETLSAVRARLIDTMGDVRAACRLAGVDTAHAQAISRALVSECTRDAARQERAINIKKKWRRW